MKNIGFMVCENQKVTEDRIRYLIETLVNKLGEECFVSTLNSGDLIMLNIDFTEIDDTTFTKIRDMIEKMLIDLDFKLVDME